MDYANNTTYSQHARGPSRGESFLANIPPTMNQFGKTRRTLSFGRKTENGTGGTGAYSSWDNFDRMEDESDQLATNASNDGNGAATIEHQDNNAFQPSVQFNYDGNLDVPLSESDMELGLGELGSQVFQFPDSSNGFGFWHNESLGASTSEHYGILSTHPIAHQHHQSLGSGSSLLGDLPHHPNATNFSNMATVGGSSSNYIPPWFRKTSNTEIHKLRTSGLAPDKPATNPFDPSQYEFNNASTSSGFSMSCLEATSPDTLPEAPPSTPTPRSNHFRPQEKRTNAPEVISKYVQDKLKNAYSPSRATSATYVTANEAHILEEGEGPEQLDLFTEAIEKFRKAEERRGRKLASFSKKELSAMADAELAMYRHYMYQVEAMQRDRVGQGTQTTNEEENDGDVDGEECGRKRKRQQPVVKPNGGESNISSKGKC